MNKVRLVAVTKPVLQGEYSQPGSIVDVEDLITYCAKVSNPKAQDDLSKKDRLLQYLIDHKHWSPFEMANAVIEIETTRDIARQILRHRSFSFQEFSQRYSDQIEFSENREIRLQDPKNRQNSLKTEDGTKEQAFEGVQNYIKKFVEDSYHGLIKMGIAKEQARVILPEGLTMSRMYMNGTIRSWIHYCALRSGNGTQSEHIDIAKKCWEILCIEIPFLRKIDLTKV